MLRVVLVLTVLVGAYGSRENVLDESITNRIAADGYLPESHRVTTEDGYILEINRIPYARRQNESSSSNTKKPVVFLMHGLLTSAVCFLVLGPESAIAYNLADAGYDVWMGNARGVVNSRNHVTLNPDDRRDKMEFFDYSFEEIGAIDVATMIDYVLKTTGQKNLHYVGHSQGGTAFLTLTSLKPEYNAKLKSVHLLAGVGYQEHTPSRLASALSERTNTIYAFTSRLGFVELDANIFDRLSLIQNEPCSGEEAAVECDLRSVFGFLKRLKLLMQVPASAAMKQIAHYGQNIRDKIFRRWDYGIIGNLRKYGSISPPEYDLSLISADVTMHYTVQDIILDERDVLAMVRTMPNAKARKIASDSFLHSDFISVPEVKSLVTDYIIEQINKYYEVCHYEY